MRTRIRGARVCVRVRATPLRGRSRAGGRALMRCGRTRRPRLRFIRRSRCSREGHRAVRRGDRSRAPRFTSGTPPSWRQRVSGHGERAERMSAAIAHSALRAWAIRLLSLSRGAQTMTPTSQPGAGSRARVSTDSRRRSGYLPAARLFKFNISSTLGSTTSSTRRFFARLASVSLAATGSVSA